MAKQIFYEFLADHKEGVHEFKKGQLKLLSKDLSSKLLKEKIVQPVVEGKLKK